MSVCTNAYWDSWTRNPLNSLELACIMVLLLAACCILVHNHRQAVMHHKADELLAGIKVNIVNNSRSVLLWCSMNAASAWTCR